MPQSKRHKRPGTPADNNAPNPSRDNTFQVVNRGRRANGRVKHGHRLTTRILGDVNAVPTHLDGEPASQPSRATVNQRRDLLVKEAHDGP